MTFASRIARLVIGFTIALSLGAPAIVASAAPAPAVRITAEPICQPYGGLDVTLTVTNLGKQTIQAWDLQAFLGAVQPGGPEGRGALFLTLAPDFGTIEPGESNSILLQFSGRDPSEPAPAAEVRRLILGIELYIVGRDQPIVRHFSFPACPA